MDYRLTDPYLDAPGGDESVYSEKSYRLPRTYWCYQPDLHAPPVGPLPADRAGFITFGCLNNFNKITDVTLDLWSDLLLQVPDSRLILFAPEGSHRQRLRDRIAAKRVDPDRVQFVSLLPLEQYLAKYNEIDIAFDPFRYPGGTTTCDALWMGVPVVSLTGNTAVSRSGLSILSNVGLAELVAHDPQKYIQIASELAHDRPRLRELRSTMRERMKGSPLMDERTFVRDVKSAFRTMWRNWCKQKTR